MPTYKAQRRLQMTRSMIHCPHVTTPWPLSLALQSFLCTYTRAIFQTEPPDPAILSAQYTVVENKSSCKLQPEEATRDKRERATAPTCGLRPRQAGPCARAGRRPRKGMAAQGPAPAQEEDSSRSQAPAAGACRLRARGRGLGRRRTCSRPAAAP